MKRKEIRAIAYKEVQRMVITKVVLKNGETWLINGLGQKIKQIPAGDLR